MVKKKVKTRKKRFKTTTKLAKKITVRGKEKTSRIVHLGLGSNVGDREEYIEQAIFLLDKIPGVKVLKKSSNYETEAEGVENQPPFINAAVSIETTLPPHKLLSSIQEVENTLGREREVEWGPRTIDIDILLYEDQIISDDKLQIPHPLLHERLFALIPLSEIAGDVLHPVLEKSISELTEEKKAELSEKYDDELPGFKEIKKGTYDDFERW